MLKIPTSFLSTLIKSNDFSSIHFCDYKGKVYIDYFSGLIDNKQLIDLKNLSSKTIPKYSLCDCSRKFVISKWANYVK